MRSRILYSSAFALAACFAVACESASESDETALASRGGDDAEGCDGDRVEGCPCAEGETRECGPAGVGACKPAKARCEGGRFGACSESVTAKPLDCQSREDRNCNGVIDADEPGCQCPEGGAPGTTRPCGTHPGLDGVGACRAGTETCVANGGSSTWSACEGSVGPESEQCDATDRDCNGVVGVDEPAPPAPEGAMNCTKIFRCAAEGRGAVYFRTGVGWTNQAGSNTVWTGYAPQGDFSDGTFPKGTYRIARDATNTKLGPVTVANECCGAGGCATAKVLFDGVGQFYTAPP